MAPPGFGGALDTPRTNIGDATYLTRQPDFADISQEATFVSPPKEGNLLQQMRNGVPNGVSLRTPRQRGPLADRRNLPQNVGGGEFTPLLKSATRNSVRRHGKENGRAMANTPGMAKIEEADMTPIPRMDMSMYTSSRNQSYMDNTLPQVDSSAASTPMALPLARGENKGPLNDGNQLSLREQENVIDRIEKENFGLKLKIHFLEEALRKAGPGFSEAALKENTDLKVDKVTMQRELHQYKKHLTTAERDLESYRQQMLELQDKAKRKYADENQRAEMDKLQQTLDTRQAEIEDLQTRLDQGQRDEDQVEKLRDDIMDLESDLRDKERLISERDDELDDLKDKLDEADDKEKDAQRRILELEQASSQNEDLEEAKDTIQGLEHDIRRLEEQLEDAKEKTTEAVSEKVRAESDLEELQEEMSNKSVVTKGLSRQIDEKVARLQQELDKAGQDYAALEKRLADANREIVGLRSEANDRQGLDHERKSAVAKIQELEASLLSMTDERDMIQSRYDDLEGERASMESEIAKLEREVDDLQNSLSEERQHELDIEKDLRNQYQDSIERLNEDISDLQAEIREKENLYDNDSEKWETEKQRLESELERAEEKAAGLQKAADHLREAQGSSSDQESKLQDAMRSETERHKSEHAVLTRQMDDLRDSLDTKQTLLNNLRNEMSTVRDELRQTQLDYKTQTDKATALEDEIDILQAALDDAESGRQDFETARRECNGLREQLDTLRQASKGSSTPGAAPSTESSTRMKWQLSDATAQLERTTNEKQSLQDQLATINLELHGVRSSLAETEAERDELDSELRRAKSSGTDTVRVDQDRLELRTAKMKLDNEVRRLKEENKILGDQRGAAEKTLEREIEKAAEEEERLGQEILQLQAKLRQGSSSDSYELAAARRTIRELERRVEDHEAQLAEPHTPGSIGGSGELSIIRRDLSSARQKELEFLQREAANRDLVKGLKRQIADLERQVHDREMSRLIASPPSSSTDTGRKREVVELRHQLTVTRQSLNEIQVSSRDVERQAAQAAQDLQVQLSELEDQKVVLEEVLEEASQRAEESAAQHDKALLRMKHKLEKAERERLAAVAVATGQDGSKSDRRHLRRSQAEVENLEHDVRQQQELLDALTASEAALRRKLDRARSERAAYRVSAEKLQRDARRAGSDKLLLEAQAGRVGDGALGGGVEVEERHGKEVRGMALQMEFMQRRWEREAALRSDAAFAKKFLQLQLDIANACNKAQLRELEHIRTGLLGSRKALPSTASSAAGQREGRPTLRTVFLMARFIARARLAAGAWAEQEALRRKLAAAAEEQRRTRRVKQLRVVPA